MLGSDAEGQAEVEAAGEGGAVDVAGVAVGALVEVAQVDVEDVGYAANFATHSSIIV